MSLANWAGTVSKISPHLSFLIATTVVCELSEFNNKVTRVHKATIQVCVQYEEALRV